MYLIPVPAFTDNYLWLLHDGKHALVVDPGDAGPVLVVLREHGLQLESILVTHHHADHTRCVAELRETSGAIVYGPATELIPAPFTPLREGDTARALGFDFQVIDVPVHTSGISRSTILTSTANRFFFAVTRFFQAVATDFLRGRQRSCWLLSTSWPLCPATRGYVAPTNTQERTCDLRWKWSRQTASWPHTSGRHTPARAGSANVANLYHPGTANNPFLRRRQASFVAAARRFDASAHDDKTVFAALRQWKNQFK